MPLTAGTHLGPYEVIASIGAGGMGEVYRARDPKLNRDVALKILPALFATDPERLARFRREAQVLASLNHPNIGHIYGFEDAPSTGSGQAPVQALVLELIDGPTLADLLRGATLPIPQVLRIAKQIAEALEAAHEQGVTHRDLKPANIKVRDDGTVKVLDFGLAKAMDPSGTSGADPINSPTFTANMTQLGVIIGTAAYMSPEQARGKPVDKRADIWAFGVVLFEMLTGRRLFDGETVSDTIAKILEREPDWSALPAEAPPKVRELVRRCLERDLKKRQRDIGDARIEIEEALASSASASGAAAPSIPAVRARRLSLRSVGFAAAFIALGIVGGAVWNRLASAPSASRAAAPVRLSVAFPANLRVINASLAPDGETMLVVAFPKNADGSEPRQPRAYMRRLDEYDFRPLSGTDGIQNTTFSPDGKSIAFTAAVSELSQLRLSKLRLDGTSPPVQLAEWDDGWGGFSWLEDGDLLIFSNSGTKFFRLPTSGGSPKAPVPLDLGSLSGFPTDFYATLPGDRGVFFSMQSWGSRGYQLDTWLLDPKTGKAQRMFERAGNVRYVSTGHLVFTRGETLMAVPFNLETHSMAGEVVPLFAGIRMRNSWAHGAFSVSNDGHLAYAPGGRVGLDRRLVALDEKGNVAPFSNDRRAFENPPAASRDGRQVATVIVNEQGTYETWVADTARPGVRRVLALPNADCATAVWSPDGQRLAFARTARNKDDGLYVGRSDGGGAPTPLLKIESQEIDIRPTSWAPDGSGVLIVKTTGGKGDILFVPVTASGAGGTPQPVRVTPYNDTNPRFSPDGKFIAFDADDTGKREVYVAAFEGGVLGTAIPVSTTGGSRPVWSNDGRRIFYQNDPNQIMVASIQTKPSLSASAPSVLHDLRKLRIGESDWDALPDGRIVAIQKGTGEDDLTQVNIVLNWFTELQQKLSGSAIR